MEKRFYFCCICNIAGRWGGGSGETADAPTTLAAAVDAAASGDTICVLEDLTVSSTVTIDKSLTIQGEAGERKPVISQEAASSPYYSIFSVTV